MQRRRSGQSPTTSESLGEPHPIWNEPHPVRVISMRLLLILFAVFPIGGVIIAYYCAIIRHQVDYPYLYISTVIQWDPSRIYGGFGMTMAAVLFLFFSYARLAFVEYRVQPNDTWTHRVQALTKIASWATVFGMVGVACIPFYRMPVTHLVFAGTSFVAAIIVALCALYVDYRVTGHFSCMIRFRTVLVVCALVSSVILGLVVMFWPFVGSVMEIFAVLCCFLFVATYAIDMRDYDVVINIRRRGGPSYCPVELDGL